MTDLHSRSLLRVVELKTWFPIHTGVLQRGVHFVRAVDGVDLSIAAGKTLALVGESGSGKTTVGFSILRLVEPREGQVWFKGVDLLSLPSRAIRPYRRELQVVFQDTAMSLDPDLTVREVVAEGLRAFRMCANERQITDRVAELLQWVRLDPALMSRYPSELSGGQRQRIGIARALAVKPKLIICDEAVSALDVSIQAQILNLLQDLQDQFGLTYLFITHDLSVVRYFAHDVAVMYLGQIVEEGDTESVFANPRHPYTRALLAAVPSVDPGKRSVQVRALGEMPSPVNPLVGCRFHTRCPEAFDRCLQEAPPLYELGERRSRCYLALAKGIKGDSLPSQGTDLKPTQPNVLL